MIKKCIICKSEALPIALNNLPMFKCSRCLLTWRQNFNLPPEFYVDHSLNLDAEKLKTRVANSKGRIHTFSKYVDLNNLCDVGCSEGVFLNVLKDAGYHNLIGIEPNKNVADYAQKNKLNIYPGTIEDIGRYIKNSDITTVSMFHVIEHLKDPRASLEKLQRVLPKGGKVIIETPNMDAFSFKALKYKHPLVYEEHLFYFNLDNLQMLMEESGFKVIAKGKRGFNVFGMSIKECLFRLGVLKSFYLQDENKKEGGSENGSWAEKGEQRKTDRLLKNFLRRLLQWMVVLMGRVDYIWLIAEKSDAK